MSEIVIRFGLARRTARKSRKYHYFTGLGAEAGTHVPAFRGPFGRAEGGVGIRAAAVVGRRSHVPARNAGRQQPTWQTKGEEERGNSPAATHQPVAVHGPRSPLHSSSRSSAQQLVFRLVRKPALLVGRTRLGQERVGHDRTLRARQHAQVGGLRLAHRSHGETIRALRTRAAKKICLVTNLTV